VYRVYDQPMRRLVPLVTAIVSAAVLAGFAGADTVKLGWHENASGNLKFVVRSINFTKNGWVVDTTFTNTSKQPVQVGTVFGLLLLTTTSTSQSAFQGAKGLPAARFSSPLPKTLKPGQSWSGTFAGTGVPPHGVYVRVIYGRFTGGFAGTQGWYWVTDHAYRFTQLPSQYSA
jgi:hypothetical protein